MWYNEKVKFRNALLVLIMINGIVTSLTVKAYTVDDIQSQIGKIGTTSITVKNDSSDAIDIPVYLSLTNPPLGYEQRNWGWLEYMHVASRSVTTKIFPKPLVSDFPNYKGDGVPLNERCRVVVILGYRGVQSGGYGSRNQTKYYDAKYIEGTKLIEVPDTIFYIGDTYQ